MNQFPFAYRISKEGWRAAPGWFMGAVSLHPSRVTRYSSPCLGFTLIELLVTLAIVAILAASAFPLSELSVRRAKERELKEALWQIRTAIDAYRKAVDQGRILRSSDQSGYPPSLSILVQGTSDAGDPAGRKIYFLRRIPRDPLADDSAVAPEQSWGKRSYESPPDAPREGKDVFDVFSLSKSVGLNGVPYKEW